MLTQCNQEAFEFHPLGQRQVRGQFDGGTITTDAGGLLLREVEKRTGIIAQFAACFRDHRDPERIEHTLKELVAQRVYALALGYEDLNDHDQLRHDPLLAVLAEKADPTGESRVRERDQGKALAGKSTLNRLELTGEVVGEEERYKKIAMDQAAVDRLLVEVFLQAHREPPPEIVLDLDATDDPVHGNQEGRFFHGYYGHYCYTDAIRPNQCWSMEFMADELFDGRRLRLLTIVDNFSRVSPFIGVGFSYKGYFQR